MGTPSLSQQALRARALARHDGFLEAVESGRSSSDTLGLLKVRVREPKTSSAGKSTALHSLPAVRPGRLIVGGKRVMHMQFSENTNRGAADFDRYITGARDGAETKAELASAQSDVGVAADFDSYATQDRATSADRAASGDRPVGQVFTNIPGTSQQRRAFWDAEFYHEVSLHKPGQDRINFKRDECQDFLKHLGDHPLCPPNLRDFATCTGRHVKAGKKLDKQRAKIGAAYVTNEAWPDYMFLCAEYDTFAPARVGRRPFTFSPARQLQTERNGDFELPHELDTAAHQHILHQVVAQIESYATPAERKVVLPDGTIVEGRLPVLIAYHPPEADNNELNDHGHFQFHDRAFAIDSDGSIHFAKDKCAALTRLGMMERFRAHVADIINVELAAANEIIRVTTKSAADLGSDETPQLKLGKGLQRLEDAGEVTDKGLHNRVVSWNRAYRENIDYVADRQRELAADDDALRLRISMAAGLSSADRQQLEDERRRVLGLQKEALENEATARYATFVIEMAESNLMARGEKASQKEALATTHQQKDLWHNATCDVVIAIRELYTELEPELATRAQAQAEAYAAEAEGMSRRTALIETVDEMIERARVREQARVDAATAAVERGHRLSDLHRAVDTIDQTPIAITRIGGRWAIAAADASSRVVAGLDLSEPEIQVRLQGLAETHHKERAIAAAWLGKHGYAAVNDEAGARATEYVIRQVRRWQSNGDVKAAVDGLQAAATATATAAAAAETVAAAAAAAVASRVDPVSNQLDHGPVKGLKVIKALIDAVRGTTQPVVLARRTAMVQVPSSVLAAEATATSYSARSDAPSEIARSTTPTASRRDDTPSAGRSISRARAGALATPRKPVNPAAAAAVARLFHDPDWSPADYSGSAYRVPARDPIQAQFPAISTTASRTSSAMTEPLAKHDQNAAMSRAHAALAQSQSQSR